MSGAWRRIYPVLNTQHATKRNCLWIGVPGGCDNVMICDAFNFVTRILTLLKLCVAFAPRAWGSLNEYLAGINRERRFISVICDLANNVLLNPFQLCRNSRSGCGFVWVSCSQTSRTKILLKRPRNGQPLWVISQEWARLLCGYTGGMWVLDLDNLD